MDSWPGALAIIHSLRPLTFLQHGTCPACRHAFLDIPPPSDSDTESEDGDYIPDEDEDDMDTEDDLDFEPEVDWDTFAEMDEEEEVDADLFDAYGAELDNLGLSESEGEGSSVDDDEHVSVTFDSASQTYVVNNTLPDIYHATTPPPNGIMQVYIGEDGRPVQGPGSSSPASKH